MRLFVIFFLLLMLTSCERVFFGESLSSQDPRTNFEYIWRQIDEKYSLFEVKNVNWQEVHDKYSSRINPMMSQIELFKEISLMMAELEDGHVNLFSGFDRAFFNVKRRGKDNFDFRIVSDNYLSRSYSQTGILVHDFLRINNSPVNIGYIRLNRFSGEIKDFDLDFILTRFKNTFGIILDLRENGGGSASEMKRLLSRFVDRETIAYYSYLKNGEEHNDFTEKHPVKIKPYSGIRYTGKVLVLVDRGSFSATSFFALATKVLTNMTLVGDYTGGGLGLPNGGQLPNGWNYRFSISKTLDLQGNNYENGVPPDIKIDLDNQDRTQDEILNRAILEITRRSLF